MITLNSFKIPYQYMVEISDKFENKVKMAKAKVNEDDNLN